MSAMPARSTRLPGWLDAEVQEFSKHRGEQVSEALRRIVAEWWVGRKLPLVEFRESLMGRRAAVRGGPEVWEIVSVARDYGEDRESLYDHFGWLSCDAVDQALDYNDRFPDEIREHLEENERVGRYLSERLT